MIVLDTNVVFWLLELSKFAHREVETEQQRWLKFFNEAERLDESALPAWMQTPEMTQAMTTLKTFSEKERAYHAYQARQNYLRVQRGIQRRMDELHGEVDELHGQVDELHGQVERERTAREQERTAREQERAAKEQERIAKEEAQAEVERLKRLLAKKPDTPSGE